MINVSKPLSCAHVNMVKTKIHWFIFCAAQELLTGIEKPQAGVVSAHIARAFGVSSNCQCSLESSTLVQIVLQITMIV